MTWRAKWLLAVVLAQRLKPGQGNLDPIGPATFHLLRGELDAAADWTEKAVDERQPAVFFFGHMAAVALRGSPRWPALARKMHLS